MEDSGNPTGTNDINNLTSLKFFSIAMAIQKNLCLAFHSYHLFLERKELLELPLKTKSAVERQLGIIGEAINKFRKEDTGHELTHAKEIINLRNRIIHAYDSIDDSIIWAIKANHLPFLKKEVEELLQK